MTPEHRALVEGYAAAGHAPSRFMLAVLRRVRLAPTGRPLRLSLRARRGASSRGVRHPPTRKCPLRPESLRGLPGMMPDLALTPGLNPTTSATAPISQRRRFHLIGNQYRGGECAGF